MSCAVCGGSRWVQAAPLTPVGYHVWLQPAKANWDMAISIPCFSCWEVPW